MKFCLFLALLLGASSAWADGLSHRKAAEDLMVVLRADAILLGWRQQLDTQAIDVINKAPGWG